MLDAATTARDRLLYQEAEKKLGHYAVCLVGPPAPVPDWTGGNAMRWPVALRGSREPEKAAQRDAASRWEGSRGAPHVVTLRHVWTKNEAHATRIKGELYTLLLGSDPEIRQLNAGWVDLPEWEIAWPLLLGEAIRNLRSRRDAVEAFGDEMRSQMIMRRARAPRF